MDAKKLAVRDEKRNYSGGTSASAQRLTGNRFQYDYFCNFFKLFVTMFRV